MASQPDYSLPLLEVSFDGFLFDMDGTIIDSTEAVVKHWNNVGKEIGVEPSVILETSHGRRSIDVLEILAPEKANWEYVKHMEGRLPLLYGSEAVEIPGARAVLDSLISQAAPWAIVTSGTVPLVQGWLKVLSLPIPEHLITAESVQDGKPDPSCYLLGRERLELQGPDKQVLVLEDSPAGIRSGKAAGCKVLGLVTSHTVEQVVGAEPDWVVKDLESVRVVRNEGGKVTIEISNALRVQANKTENKVAGWQLGIHRGTASLAHYTEAGWCCSFPSAVDTASSWVQFWVQAAAFSARQAAVAWDRMQGPGHQSVLSARREEAAGCRRANSSRGFLLMLIATGSRRES
ncbi:hypothetical protein G7046_g6493 [Stylonectria norvegica]|nr:hypothetical protein G7046_g6493 [Stylonectria norvegica]